MERARRLSKQLFGAAYRLEVCAALTSGELVTLTGLAERLGRPPSVSSLAKELQILEQAELLIRQPPVEGMRSVYLQPKLSPLWETCRVLLASAAASDASTSTPTAVDG